MIKLAGVMGRAKVLKNNQALPEDIDEKRQKVVIFGEKCLQRTCRSDSCCELTGAMPGRPRTDLLVPNQGMAYGEKGN